MDMKQVVRQFIKGAFARKMTLGVFFILVLRAKKTFAKSAS